MHDERLEQFEGHALGQPALIHFEFGANHDDGTPGVVHALAEEVLPEAALLALEQVAQGFESVVALALHGLALAGPLSMRESTASCNIRFSLRIIRPGARMLAKRLSRWLRDSTRRYRSLRSLVAKRPPSSLDHGAEFRREDRQDGHNHVLHTVLAAPEGLQEPHALAGLGANLGGRRPHLQFGVVPLLVKVGVHELQELEDGLRTHVGIEGVAPERLEPVVAAGGKDGEPESCGSTAGDVEFVGKFDLVARPSRELEVIPDPFNIGAAEGAERDPSEAIAWPG